MARNCLIFDFGPNNGRAVLAKIGFRLPDFFNRSLEHRRKMRRQAAEIFKTGIGVPCAPIPRYEHI